MIRHVIVGVALLGACGPAEAPATPAGQEAAAVCATRVHVKQVPDETLRDAFSAAQRAAVFPDMKRATGWYGEIDLAEQLAQLRAVAEAAGVRRCPLADELQKVVEAGPTANDCDGLVKVIEAIATVSPEHVETVIAAGCSELAGCARECVPGLASMAAVGPEHRARQLALGCAAFRADMSRGPGAFARARLGAFADACAPLLGAQAGRVAELRGQIGL
jgi:hypothetical protein